MPKALTVLLLITIIGCTPIQQNNQIQDTAEFGGIKKNAKVYTLADLTGKTIEYRYGESIYHVTIDTDSTMHWEAMAGDEEGAKYEEKFKWHQLDEHRVFITWGEANGIGVSQVLDFESATVYNHLLRGRNISIGTGQVSIIE